jgi:hypothetical protein
MSAAPPTVAVRRVAAVAAAMAAAAVTITAKRVAAGRGRCAASF